MAKRVTTGIVFALMLFAWLRVVPAQQRGGLTPGTNTPAYRTAQVVRLDPAFDAIVPAGALIERVAGGFGFAEGPVWTREGALLFSDIPGNTIIRSYRAAQITLFRRPIYLGTGLRQGTTSDRMD